MHGKALVHHCVPTGPCLGHTSDTAPPPTPPPHPHVPYFQEVKMRTSVGLALRVRISAAECIA